jgi:hypothetical protein
MGRLVKAMRNSSKSNVSSFFMGRGELTSGLPFEGLGRQPHLARIEAVRRWRFTDEGREYRQIRRGFAHAVELQPDGSFRIDEVQSGAYQLHVKVKGFDKLIREFDVPGPPAGQSDAPVDLGTLVLKRS